MSTKDKQREVFKAVQATLRAYSAPGAPDPRETIPPEIEGAAEVLRSIDGLDAVTCLIHNRHLLSGYV